MLPTLKLDRFSHEVDNSGWSMLITTYSLQPHTLFPTYSTGAQPDHEPLTLLCVAWGISSNELVIIAETQKAWPFTCIACYKEFRGLLL